MEVVDGEVVSIKAATASVQNPWHSELPIRFSEKSFPNHVQGKYNNKLSWQIARKVKNARKNGHFHCAQYTAPLDVLTSRIAQSLASRPE